MARRPGYKPSKAWVICSGCSRVAEADPGVVPTGQVVYTRYCLKCKKIEGDFEKARLVSVGKGRGRQGRHGKHEREKLDEEAVKKIRRRLGIERY